MQFANRHRLLQPRGLSPQNLMPPPPPAPPRYLCSPPPFFLNDVLIVQTPEAIHKDTQLQDVIHKRVEHKTLPKPPIRRRKVFFDPQYLTAEQLRNPPDAAEHFRAQIHCMVNITKSRLERRKFLPHLEMIDEDGTLRQAYLNQALMCQLYQLNECQSVGQTPEKGHPTDLDAVVLQVKPVPPPKVDDLIADTSPATLRSTKKLDSNDWSKILKDEWGSNESLAKVPLRKRIHDVFLGTTTAAGGNGGKPKGEKPKMQLKVLSAEEGKPKMKTAAKVATASDDEECSDQASSKSGKSSSGPEKDSGIEDDGNSDKSNASPGHKNAANGANGKVDVPGMISRKKIVSASSSAVTANNSSSVAIGVSPLPVTAVSATARGRPASTAPPAVVQPVFWVWLCWLFKICDLARVVYWVHWDRCRVYKEEGYVRLWYHGTFMKNWVKVLHQWACIPMMRNWQEQRFPSDVPLFKGQRFLLTAGLDGLVDRGPSLRPRRHHYYDASAIS